jgi:hypothetical protein
MRRRADQCLAAIEEPTCIPNRLTYDSRCLSPKARSYTDSAEKLVPIVTTMYWPRIVVNMASCAVHALLKSS